MVRRTAHFRGFTLLEIILLMVIICVALASAAPLFRNFAAGRRYDDAAVQVLAAAEYARNQAIADGRMYRLVIDREANTYRILVQEQGAFLELGKDIGNPPEFSKDIRLSMTRADGGAVDYIDFYPSGRADPALIEVRGENSAPIRIACDSPTEAFRILSPEEAGKR